MVRRPGSANTSFTHTKYETCLLGLFPRPVIFIVASVIPDLQGRSAFFCASSSWVSNITLRRSNLTHVKRATEGSTGHHRSSDGGCVGFPARLSSPHSTYIRWYSHPALVVPVRESNNGLLRPPFLNHRESWTDYWSCWKWLTLSRKTSSKNSTITFFKMCLNIVHRPLGCWWIRMLKSVSTLCRVTLSQVLEN